MATEGDVLRMETQEVVIHTPTQKIIQKPIKRADEGGKTDLNA